mgnify:CR=1 FL=1
MTKTPGTFVAPIEVDPLLMVTPRISETGDEAVVESRWEHGSLSERVSRISAFRTRGKLQTFLHELESSFMPEGQAAPSNPLDVTVEAYASQLEFHVDLLRKQYQGARKEQVADSDAASRASDAVSGARLRAKARLSERRADSLQSALRDKEQAMHRFQALPIETKRRVAREKLGRR